jgi:predicted Rdx family selenoprotein
VPQLPTVRPAYRTQRGLTLCRSCQQIGRHTWLREALRSATTVSSSAGIQISVIPYAVLELPTLWQAYRSQIGLTQCHNCQQFVRHTRLRQALRSPTTANSLAMSWLTLSILPLHVVWGRPPAQILPREGDRCSTPRCCNCQIVEGEILHPAKCLACRHA